MLRLVISNLLGLVGAAVGGVAGFLHVPLAARARVRTAGMIPGAFLGFGCSLLARHPSIARGIVCGIAGPGAGSVHRVWFRPSMADSQFPDISFKHVKDLSPFP